MFYSEHEDVCDTHITFFGKTLFNEFSALLYIALLFNFVTLLFLAHLIYYHINLLRRGMTTYEYIREQQDKKTLSSLYKRTGVDEKAI
jgi:hypothetical protein